jgi:hypothetical protein
MKYLNKLFMALCMMGCGLTIQAQNTIPTTGGSATGSGGILSEGIKRQ